MRALCGAIITAGALIGLGIAALGIGTRYQHWEERASAAEGQLRGELTYVLLKQLDTPLMVILVVLLATVVVGLAIAFIGLAYHHERRHRELHREAGSAKSAHALPPS